MRNPELSDPDRYPPSEPPADRAEMSEDEPAVMAAAEALMARWEDRGDPTRTSLTVIGEDPRTVAAVAVAAVRAERDRLAGQLAAIRALHEPDEIGFDHACDYFPGATGCTTLAHISLAAPVVAIPEAGEEK